MGIQSIPAPSTASAPYVGAGSVAATAYSTQGFYTTTLSAGIQDAPKWHYGDSINDQYASNNLSNDSIVVNLTTASQIWLYVDGRFDHGPTGKRYYSSQPNTQLYRAAGLKSAVSNLDVGAPIVGYRNSSNTQARFGWLLTPTTFSGISSTYFDQEARMALAT